MTTQLTTPTARGRKARGPARPRTVRSAGALVGVAALIAAGGYGATKTFGPDAYEPQAAPAPSEYMVPSDQVQRDLRESVAGQYGRRPASATSAYVTPSAQAQRDLRNVAANLYGPRP